MEAKHAHTNATSNLCVPVWQQEGGAELEAELLSLCECVWVSEI